MSHSPHERRICFDHTARFMSPGPGSSLHNRTRIPSNSPHSFLRWVRLCVAQNCHKQTPNWPAQIPSVQILMMSPITSGRSHLNRVTIFTTHFLIPGSAPFHFAPLRRQPLRYTFTTSRALGKLTTTTTGPRTDSPLWLN